MKKSGAVARVLQSALVMDTLACAALAAGSVYALSPFTLFTGGPWVYFWTALACAALTAALSRKWWLTPAAAACAALFAAAGWYWRGERTPFWARFAGWLASGANQQGLTDPGFLTAARWLAVLAASAALFALIRKLFCFPVLLALQAGALVLPAALKNEPVSEALCLCVSGLIVLLPRVYARRIVKLGVDVESQTVLRARMQAVAVPAAALAAAAGLLLTPADTAGWRSRFLNNMVDDIRLAFGGPLESWPDAASNFNLYGMGFQAVSERLGGPVMLTDGLQLSVETKRPALLKGRVLDYYTGETWYMTAPDGDMRFGSMFLRRYRREAFGTDKPLGSREAKRLYEQLTAEAEFHVTHETPRYNTLFAAGAVSGLRFDRWLAGPEAYFNMRSELYLHNRIPQRGGYTVRTRVWNTGVTGFDALFTRLEAETGPDAWYEANYPRFTQLPETLPARVREAADGITRGISSPYLKAKAISGWLYENFEYTLEPETPPEGVDFTAWFLDSGEGYCVYYATAMTVLARCAGLPARYVQGFALESVYGSPNLYQATGKTAHAWCEVYFEGIGWFPVDPLSWNADQPLNQEAPPYEPTPTPTPTPHSGASLATPTPTPPPEPDEAQPMAMADEKQRRRLMIAVAAVAAMLAAGLFLGVRAAMGRKARQWSLERVQRRCPDAAGQLDALYADTLQLLALCGLTPYPGETLVTFPERIDLHIKLEEIPFREVAEAVSRQKFACAPPEDKDVARACRYHELLESHVRELLGKARYLFRRAIW